MITITLPLPPPELSPNARGHWSKKARAVKKYRALAEMEARKIPARYRQNWPHAVAHAAFFLPDARARDHDNLFSSLKSAFDGIADADVLANDRGLTHRPISTSIDRENPRVELTLEPAPN